MHKKKNTLYVCYEYGTKFKKYIIGIGGLIAALLLVGQAFALIEKKGTDPYLLNKFISYHVEASKKQDTINARQERINEVMIYKILHISAVQQATSNRFIKSQSDSIFREDSIRIQSVMGAINGYNR